MRLTRDDKIAIRRQAQAYMKVVGESQWHIALAALYTAAQVIEREMTANFDVEPRLTIALQLAGRRLGIDMGVETDIEYTGKEEVN